MLRRRKLKALRAKMEKLDEMSFNLVDNPKEYYKLRSEAWSLSDKIEKVKKMSFFDVLVITLTNK